MTEEARALKAVAQMKQGRVVPITEDVALSAALVSLTHKLPMADSFIYAAARAERATLWTQDAHFAALPNVRYKEPGPLRPQDPFFSFPFSQFDCRPEFHVGFLPLLGGPT